MKLEVFQNHIVIHPDGRESICLMLDVVYQLMELGASVRQLNDKADFLAALKVEAER